MAVDWPSGALVSTTIDRPPNQMRTEHPEEPIRRKPKPDLSVVWMIASPVAPLDAPTRDKQSCEIFSDDLLPVDNADENEAGRCGRHLDVALP